MSSRTAAIVETPSHGGPAAGRTRSVDAWPGRRKRLWMTSGLVALALHVGGVAAAIGWRSSPPAPPPPVMTPPATMIDLAPPAEAPTTPAVEKPVETVPQPPPVTKTVKVAPAKPKIAPPPRASRPEVPAETSEPRGEAALAAPPPARPAAPSPPAAPPQTAAGAAAPSWQSSLLAHLERNKRYAAAALARRQQGVAVVRFVMDRDGMVLSVKLERESGYAALDDEALALVTRAQPLPPPPPEVKGDRIELVVPVQFFLK